MVTTVDLNNALGGTFPNKPSFLSSWRELKLKNNRQPIDGLEIIGFAGNPNRADNVSVCEPCLPVGYYKPLDCYFKLSTRQSVEENLDPSSANKRDEVEALFGDGLITYLNNHVPGFEKALVLYCKKPLLDYLSVTPNDLNNLGFEVQELNENTLVLIGNKDAVIELSNTWSNALIIDAVKNMEAFFTSGKSNQQNLNKAREILGMAFHCSSSKVLRAQAYLLDSLALKCIKDTKTINRVYDLLVKSEMPEWNKDDFLAAIDDLEKAFKPNA